MRLKQDLKLLGPRQVLSQRLPSKMHRPGGNSPLATAATLDSQASSTIGVYDTERRDDVSRSRYPRILSDPESGVVASNHNYPRMPPLEQQRTGPPGVAASSSLDALVVQIIGSSDSPKR